MPSKKMSRRGLFRSGAVLAAAGVSASIPETALAAPAPALEVGGNLYESIGVTPIVNCRGTYTIITGSQTLPEVKRAMEAASHAYVHMDELMEAVGQRLAELTKAEWGIVTAGCAAALTHATSACICGRRSGKDAARAQSRRAEERSGGAALFAQRIRSRRAHAGREDGGGGNRRAVRSGRSRRGRPW